MALLKNIKPHLNLGPGDQIKEYLELFNWTQDDLASVIGISPKHLNNIIQNRQSINIETAKLLSKVFGHSAQFWVNLDTEFRLKSSFQTKEESDVVIKTLLYKFMPINEMMKRNWITKTKDATILLENIKIFWNNDNINELFFSNLFKPFAFRKSDSYDNFNLYYSVTWLQMAKNFSQNSKLPEFNINKLEELAKEIHTFTISQSGIEFFLNELEKTGVKFLFLKHLPKTYIDGATFYVGETPVLIYTGRYNRIDHFWFTIAHEIGHILKHLTNDVKEFIDDEKLKDKRSKIEKEADEFASLILKHKEIFEFFGDGLNYITENQIMECSENLQIHKGIIIGALAFKKTISYTHLHKYTKPIIDKIPLKYFAEKR